MKVEVARVCVPSETKQLSDRDMAEQLVLANACALSECKGCLIPRVLIVLFRIDRDVNPK